MGISVPKTGNNLMVAMRTLHFIFWGLFFITLSSHTKGADGLHIPKTAPLTTDKALQVFKTENGFQMQLVASEPLVQDPVAAAFDEDGNLFVVEMSDYPNPLPPNTPPKGRIRKLMDSDDDGIFDKATVFAEGLFWPTGVVVSRGGIFVLSVPDIWYFKDTDGDGKADVKEQIATGFVIYNVQQLANNLRWGIDNKIYGITAGNGANLSFPNSSQKELSLRRRDFKFDPFTKSFEAISGTGQFGLGFDDYYHRFTCANRDPVLEIVMPTKAMDRNPDFAITNSVHNCVVEGANSPISVYPISPPEPWRVIRTERYKAEGRTFAQSEMVANGVFTSASGITIYRGDAYPSAMKGQAFIANSAGNLIHRRLLEPNGVSTIAKPLDDKSEIVRSKDIWFRPVNFVHAPDGTLYVLDLYREIVEHPWSIPDDIKEKLDFDNGRDKGRIYRLAPANFNRRKTPKLSTATTKELVSLLGHPSSWHRETAQRLLVEKGALESAPLLTSLLGQKGNPLEKLHAIYALEGLKQNNLENILRILNDNDPGLREHGLQLASNHLQPQTLLGSPSGKAVRSKVLALAKDDNPKVRFQAIITLGGFNDNPSEIAEHLSKALISDTSDGWIRQASLSSSVACTQELLLILLKNDPYLQSPFAKETLRQLAYQSGKSSSNNLPNLVALMDKASFPRDTAWAILSGFAEGRQKSGTSFGKASSELKLEQKKWVEKQGRESFALAMDPSATDVDRSFAITTALNIHSDSLGYLKTLLDSKHPSLVQIAAIKHLRNSADPANAKLMIESWNGLTPMVRTEIITALMSRIPWTSELLKALEEGKIQSAQIDLAKRQLLLKNQNSSIQKRAEKIFGPSNSSRQEVVQAYKSSLNLEGSYAKGMEIFKKECASCHKIGQEGKDLGPNLLTVGTRTPDAFLYNILDPSREVDAKYLNYVISTKDGKTFTGMLASESASTITLVKTDGSTDAISRKEIESLESTGVSFMPVGFEEKITKQQMADLLAFLLAPR